MKPGMAARQFAGIAVAAVGVWLGSAGVATAATGNIFSVAGTGAIGFSGNGGPATNAKLAGAYGVASAPDGSFVIAEPAANSVRRIAPDGTITIVAGTGVAGFSGDGGPATAAMLNSPVRVAIKPDGSIVIADYGNNRIRQVSPAGTISTIAGNGTAGYSGDGGPATGAMLDSPFGVAIAADGAVLFADYDNNRVRRISPSGTISTVAGTGGAGYSGDGGPATSAVLNGPYSIATNADGAFVIADANNHRVRRVAPSGIITTLAGTGAVGDTGDGGPATAAQLNTPRGVAVAPDGSVLIADSFNHRVRRVAPGGTISTLAGTGLPGPAVDGGPAVSAQLKLPLDVAATAAGGVLISDYFNWRIRWVDADLQAPAGGSGSTAPAPVPVAAPAPPKLAIALGFSSITMRAGRFVSVRFGATVPAAVTLKVRRNGHTVKTLTRNAHDGRNTIRFRMPRRSGRYVLNLRAVSSDGQVATDRARVTLARR